MFYPSILGQSRQKGHPLPVPKNPRPMLVFCAFKKRCGVEVSTVVLETKATGEAAHACLLWFFYFYSFFGYYFTMDLA